MRSSEITADVRAFFTTYCTAFIRRDAPAIARHFADQVHLASETGKSVRVQVQSGDEWRKTIDHLLEMYRAIDVASAEVTAMSVHPISSRLVQASLQWALRDGSRAPLYEFDALYTLARHSETFRIIAIAHNEIPQYRRCAERVGAQRATQPNAERRPMSAQESSEPIVNAESEKWTEVDGFFSDALIPWDPILESVLESSRAAGLPAISVSPNQGKLLEIFARMLDAQSILEIGTLGAYSTIWLARGMRAGGRLITLESDPAHAAVARANIARAGLESVVELRLGSASDTLPRISAERRAPFDLIFIDADKKNIPSYFEWALRLSRPGSIIIVDNVVRDGRVIDSKSDDPDIQGVRRFLEMVGTNAAVSGTAIQTVGLKGYDGFAVVRVLSPDQRRRS